MHKCNHLDAYGKEQNIALTDMFWSEQMFPNPHGGSDSENNTPFPGGSITIISIKLLCVKTDKSVQTETSEVFSKGSGYLHIH